MQVLQKLQNSCSFEQTQNIDTHLIRCWFWFCSFNISFPFFHRKVNVHQSRNYTRSRSTEDELVVSDSSQIEFELSIGTNSTNSSGKIYSKLYYNCFVLNAIFPFDFTGHIRHCDKLPPTSKVLNSKCGSKSVASSSSAVVSSSSGSRKNDNQRRNKSRRYRKRSPSSSSCSSKSSSSSSSVCSRKKIPLDFRWDVHFVMYFREMKRNRILLMNKGRSNVWNVRNRNEKMLRKSNCLDDKLSEKNASQNIASKSGSRSKCRKTTSNNHSISINLSSSISYSHSVQATINKSNSIRSNRMHRSWKYHNGNILDGPIIPMSLSCR